MDLRELVMTTFVTLQADWSAEESSQLIEQLRPSHVIVHRHDPQESYLLLSAQDALQRLIHASPLSSVDEALQLQTHPATATLESDTDAQEAPDQCVVLEDGRLIGFFDASVPPLPPQQRSSQRGEHDRVESIGPDLALRSLVTTFPEKVHLHESFSLQVSLSRDSTPEPGRAKPFVLPVGATVNIVVQPRQGCILDGSGEGILVVSNEQETPPLQFKLRGVTPGAGRLRVLAFHKGQLRIRVSILEAPVNNSQYHRNKKQRLFSVIPQQPDLQLLILGHPGDEGPEFTFHLTAHESTLELNWKRFGPIRLKVDAQQYFQEFFQDIEQLSLNDKEMAAQRLADKGAHLFRSLFPPDLQQLLWSLRNRIRSVEVQSVEPWIPWELCKLYGPEHGRVAEGPFLCEAFTLTRWIPGLAKKPHLSLKNMALVVPADSRLSSVAQERDYLLSHIDCGWQATHIPATFLELRKALASGMYDGRPFSGRIILENKEALTPQELSGVVSNLVTAKPFVFLNACQVGRSAMSLTDIGGWAKGFLDAGAGAFIGPYWSIYDQPAFGFARELYGRLCANIPIGRAVQEARVAIKSQFPGDPTWMAYTVFVDPLAMIQE